MKTHTLTLVTPSAITELGEAPTVAKAFKWAKRAAGAGATFVTRGMSRGFHGSNGMVWVSR